MGGSSCSGHQQAAGTIVRWVKIKETYEMGAIFNLTLLITNKPQRICHLTKVTQGLTHKSSLLATGNPLLLSGLVGLVTVSTLDCEDTDGQD